MANKSFYATKTGVDFVNGKLVTDQPLEYNLTSDDSPVGFGKTITPRAATFMIHQKIKENVQMLLDKLSKEHITSQEQLDKINGHFSNDRIAIEFGKESLLRILAQDECIGIRFTFCKNTAQSDSIVAIGISEEKTQNQKISVPLKKASFSPQSMATSILDVSNPIIEEEGVGKTTKAVIEDMGLSLDSIINEAQSQNDSFVEKLSATITKSFFGFR